MLKRTPQLLGDIFVDPAWYFLTKGELLHLKVWPNRLAHNKSSETFALIPLQSRSGDDFSVGRLALEYAEVLPRELKNGMLIKAAFVVYAVPDRLARNPVLPYKILHVETAAETRERVSTQLQTKYAAWGDYWWVSLPMVDDDSPY